MDIYSVIVQFFQEGGLFIYPIAAVLTIGLAISIERWIFLLKERNRNVKSFDQFLPLLRTNDHEKMTLFTRDDHTVISRIIGCGLDMMKVSKQRSDVEHAMSEGVLEALPNLEQRTGYLAMLANVATLLGLLGTIVGLIAAFSAVANADPAEKSALLSSSISVAMNTTAFGLIVAIPLLVMHTVLQNKTTAIVSSLEMAGVKFLNVMTLNRAIKSADVHAVSLSSDTGELSANSSPIDPSSIPSTSIPSTSIPSTSITPSSTPIVGY